MKKKLIFISLFVFLSSWACEKPPSQTELVTTINPFKQIIQPLLGDDLKIQALMPPGASPHTFQLKPSQIKLVERAGILFTGHANLDRWADDLPAQKKIELIPLIPEQDVLYFDDTKTEADPHFWTDPLTVHDMLPVLKDSLLKYTSMNIRHLEENTGKFSAELLSLHDEIAGRLASFQGNAVVLSHPFFYYYLKRYGFKIAAIIELHPGKHPTPKSVEKMIESMIKNNVKIILTHPAHSDDVARLLSESTGIPVCKMDPLGSSPHIKTYQDLIRFNTDKLLETLNE
jgi:zinc transport system substrate-binding protein